MGSGENPVGEREKPLGDAAGFIEKSMKTLLKAIKIEADRLQASPFHHDNRIGLSLRNILKLEKQIAENSAKREEQIHNECLDAAFGAGGQG